MAAGAVVWSADYECDIGPHVFPTQKFRLVHDRLVADGLVSPGGALTPGTPERSRLALVHTEAYLRDLDELRWSERTMRSELPLTSGIVTAYALAAEGTTLAAREALERGAAAHAGGGFHHAYPDHGEGFCYLNDLAVAVRALQHEGRIARAAVVDLDVHQGNGTAAIFADDPRVFTLSIHQENNYPVPKERGDLDVGLADGTGDEDYLRALDRALEPVWRHAPDLLLYQAGADPYAEDVLGGLGLSLAGLEARDARVIDGCRARGIPLVVTLGGGYARAVEDTVRIHATTCALALRNARR
ncbi:MAG TPA: histone deacetylase [Candidatus Acidoferrales bacterium]|nr:histone deacetylase [Candidatus Acidoferrales bacterium]